MITMVHEIQSRHFYEKLLTLKYQKYQCPNYDIIYQEILIDSEDNSNIMSKIADIYFETGQFDNSIKFYKKWKSYYRKAIKSSFISCWIGYKTKTLNFKDSKMPS